MNNADPTPPVNGEMSFVGDRPRFPVKSITVRKMLFAGLIF